MSFFLPPRRQESQLITCQTCFDNACSLPFHRAVRYSPVAPGFLCVGGRLAYGGGQFAALVQQAADGFGSGFIDCEHHIEPGALGVTRNLRPGIMER
jgi:hypothetical protein